MREVTLDKSKWSLGVFMLFSAAFIWGLAFVFQKSAMDKIGPYMFNAFRFTMATVALTIFLYFKGHFKRKILTRKAVEAGLLSGVGFAVGISLQQVGLLTTSAGKAGFITGLYIILVPLTAYFLFRDHIGRSVWIASLLALCGLYLLTVNEAFTIEIGDFLVLLGVPFWAIIILAAGYYANKVDLWSYVYLQCGVAMCVCWAIALFMEPIEFTHVIKAGPEILYMGIGATMITLILQVNGQKFVPPSIAALIISFETVFAAIGGMVLLGERFGVKELLGASLLLFAIFLAQIPNRKSGC